MLQETLSANKCSICGTPTHIGCDCAEETKEIKGDFGATVNKGIEQALGLIKEKYENRPDEKDNLPFHNAEHTKGVVDNVEKILKAIQQASPDLDLVSDHDVQIGRLAAAYHDTVQDWKENKVKEGEFEKVSRKRLAGSNETKSGEEAAKFMRDANQNGAVFSEQDIQTVKRAIDTTVPGGWDGKTVIQTNLTKNSSLVERALALADLATAGMEGSKRFLEEGPAIFREENLDILEAIRSGENISKDKQDYFKERMIKWLRDQPAFARGRQARLAVELEAIPEPARAAVAGLFDKFEDSIQKSQEVADEAGKESFEKLIERMGYKRS
ncbi:MAG: hypothetical protein Q7S18_01735 [bacterium]|nr:hypothetical protein [bacterium]